MNGRQAKDLRKRAMLISEKSWWDRKYIVRGLPRAYNPEVPPVPEGMEISHHMVRVKDGWFPVVNPIRLDRDCGRAFVKRFKKLFKNEGMKVVPRQWEGDINAAILQ